MHYVDTAFNFGGELSFRKGKVCCYWIIIFLNGVLKIKQALAWHAHPVTHTNQGKWGSGGRWKACPKAKLHGLILPMPNPK